MYMPRDGKVNEMPNPKTAEEIFAEKDAKIAELEAELAALKEKYRWRNVERRTKMKTYKVTEKQLEKLNLCLDELSGIHKDMGDYDICVNPLDIEDAKKKLNETIRELKFLTEDIENQPLEDSEDAR